MNITFLIGNGFDRNLGLDTTYADFINAYKATKSGSKILEKFRNHIKDNEKLWRNAEIALGKYTSEFEVGDGMSFSECHQDICEHLVEFLKNEEKRFLCNECIDNIFSAFKGIVEPYAPFPTLEKATINSVFNKLVDGRRIFNFICYNYTSTLDQILDIVKQNESKILGQHQSRGITYPHSLGRVCHVHGTLDKEIVFAVNDETQIVNPEIFDFEDGEICKNLLIKQNANALYQENTDAKANQILQESNIIYIYGMSLGETDALWWKRVCAWLAQNSEHHVIIQNYEMLHKGVYQLPYLLAEKRRKMQLLSYSELDDATKQALYKRIHVTGANIFSELHNVAIGSKGILSEKLA